MNYHDTVPSEPGKYALSGDSWLALTHDGEWILDNEYGWRVRDVKAELPIIGPLPVTDEAMLALACEVAFARMACASSNHHRDILPTKLLNEFVGCRNRFTDDGERSLSLLRDLQLVTRELTREQQETP